MAEIKIDYTKSTGKVKPMHAVNNGPVYKFSADQRITNMDAYKNAGIPFARIHDAAFFSTYGGEHCVDINAIFPNFDSDPYAPSSYDFTLTDEYFKVIYFAGTKVFFRLGSKIEHWPKKYNILPPKNFEKWAVICEHIVRHYNEGWADGFKYDIKYWEIWNEPDYDCCWGGTKEEYFGLYDVAATHLKKSFPDIKVGGPALCWNFDWAKEFIEQLKAPLDFFSWHCYTRDPAEMKRLVGAYRKLLDDEGYTHTESILDEWNYVRSFTGDDWVYSLKQEKGLKGSSYTAAAMCMCQYEPLDMLMYYDARPCSMNGLFCTDFICECLKGYYPFLMFNTLYKLGESFEATSNFADAYACAAKKDGKAAIMLTHFAEDDSKAAENFEVKISGFAGQKGGKATYYILDAAHDMEKVKEEVFSGVEYIAFVNMPLHASCLIELEKID